MTVALDDGSALIALRSRDSLARPVTVIARIDGTRVERLPDPPGEPVALVAAQGAAAFLVAYQGVFRIEGTSYAALRAEGFELRHPYGAFRGASGRVRVLGAGPSAGCVDGERVVACAWRELDDRLVHPLDDGLVVEDQHIDTWLVTDAGASPLDDSPWHSVQYPRYAGRSGELVVLAGRDIGFLTADEWSRATVPEPWIPQTIARAADGRAVVGLEGGAVLSASRP